VSSHARFVVDGAREETPDLAGTWRTFTVTVIAFSSCSDGPAGDLYEVAFPDRTLYAEVVGRTLTLSTEPPAPPAPPPPPPPEPAESGGVLNFLEGLWNRALGRSDPEPTPTPTPVVTPDPSSAYRIDGRGFALKATPVRALVVDGRKLGTFRRVDLVAEWGRDLAAKGAAELRRRSDRHWNSIDRTGIGTHYGDHSSFHRKSPAEKRAWIERHKKAGTTPPRLRRSSCIGWVLENVGAAYRASGKGERWKEIYREVTSKGAKGTDLAKALEEDGWVAVYWNPDTKKPSDGSAEHTYTAREVRKGNPYYGIATDPSRLVVDYKPSSNSPTRRDRSGYDKLAQVPFWFGLARGGSHTFVGSGSTLSEFHWSDMPNSKNAIDEKPFEEFSWLSGVIMVPPGTWPK
jgi:hypothetical protein